MEEDHAVQIELAEPESNHDAQNATTKSTPADAEHMRRMGHEQQLVRNFKLFSVAAFTAISIAAWEIGLFLISQGLLDGGRPALLYSIIWNFVGFGPIYLSMAEMASMAPIAGAQYHWVSEFAPASIQKLLSYFTGWTSTVAYQAGNVIGVFLVATLVQSIIQINKPDYAFPPWHATLLVIGAVCIAFAGNVFGASVLSKWQNAVFCVHVTAYLLFIVPIWCNAPRATSKQVWTEFENAGGWSNMGLTVMVGQLSGIYTQVGCDNVSPSVSQLV